MATARFDNLDTGRQEQILDAAADEFAEKGYESASINQIIANAGISKGSMYYYFEDKRDLYDTVMKHATERLIAMAGGFDVEEMQRDNFWAYLEAYSERSLKELRKHDKYIQLARGFYQAQQADPESMKDSETMEWGRQVTHQMIQRGQQFGVVRTDLPVEFLAQVSMAMGTVMDGWLLDQFDELSEDEVEELIKTEVDLLRRVWRPASPEDESVSGGKDD